MNRNFLSSIYFLPGLLSFFLLSNTRILETISTTVSISDGKIEGIKEVSGVLSFKGIPYALPPIQSLRWKAPQPLTPWTGIKKCTVFAASPMQADPAPFSMWSQEFLIPKEPIDEDCLYLNVWTGARSVNEKRPVLVWIYGGGFNSGGSAVPIYNGETLAKKGIVFVSINYRVGIFGFLAHPWLTKESPYNASGNYGMLDQVAALQWVKKNISNFGGDPENVTIAGQSAGSMSVNCLIASPLAHGLFNKAIAESGASFLRNSPLALRVSQMDLKQAEQEGIRVAAEFKANSLEELKKIPADELLKKIRFSSRPIIDGYFLPESIPAIFKQHKENKVALLTGWNEEEGLLFGPVKTAKVFQQDIEKQYGADAGVLLQYYPANNDAEAADSQLNCPETSYLALRIMCWPTKSAVTNQMYLCTGLPAKYQGQGSMQNTVPFILVRFLMHWIIFNLYTVHGRRQTMIWQKQCQPIGSILSLSGTQMIVVCQIGRDMILVQKKLWTLEFIRRPGQFRILPA